MVNSENLLAIFYYIAIFSTLVFVIKTLIFAFTGGDSEVFADFNTEFETETSFDFISIQSILAFFMGFGWMGFTCMKQFTYGAKLSLLLAFLFGLVLMFVSAYLMFLVKKLNKKVIKNYADCVGKLAKTYTSFAPNSEGQIEVLVNNRLSIEPAVNNSDKQIEAFKEVRVIKYENKKFYIEESIGD